MGSVERRAYPRTRRGGRSRARSPGGWARSPRPRDDGKAILDYLQTKAPPVYDPFSGGGSIPLEAQRLGLRAYGSDLNPVAVLIGRRWSKSRRNLPVCRRSIPIAQAELRRGGQMATARARRGWPRTCATTADGCATRPKSDRASLPEGEAARWSEATVIAWLWARTVRSPDPAAKGAMVPLVSSFMLSTKEGKEGLGRADNGRQGAGRLAVRGEKRGRSRRRMRSG